MRFLVAWIFFIVGAFAMGIGQIISTDAYNKFIELVLYDMFHEEIEAQLKAKT